MKRGTIDQTNKLKDNKMENQQINLNNVLQNENFHHQMVVNAPDKKVFESLTSKISFWWTEMFEGASDKQGDVFTVRFGASVFKTIIVEELIVSNKIVWLVSDTLIDIPGLTNKTEWLNTRIVWEITQQKEKTLLKLTHIGLNSGIECYDICSVGWHQFTESLIAFTETGNGNPFKDENKKLQNLFQDL
jgi:hypothetical protein